MLLFSNGMLNAQEKKEHATYYDGGQLKSKTTFVDGLMDGQAYQWYPNGNLRLLQVFKKGRKPYETAYYMFAPGLKMWERSFLPTDSTTFRSREWYPNQQLKGEFVTMQGHLHGHFKYFTEAGRPLEKTYHKGTLVNGTDWFRIDRPGNHQSFERLYADSSCYYLKWTEYSEQGTTVKTENYTGADCSRQGIKDGTWKEWYPNGQLIYQMHYESDVPVGEWQWWHENGQLKTTFRYENGKVVSGSVQEWNADGTPVGQ
ncbi:MAG: toxin-antitoxin system YwqK family antitoxin [Salibacteraceae bacterium]